MTPMTTSALLTAALQEIDEHGWCQYQEFSVMGSVCALGALKVASGARRARQAIEQYQLFEVRHRPAWLAYSILRQLSPLAGVEIYNDQPTTTLADVRAWFQAAIHLAQEQEAAQHVVVVVDRDARDQVSA